ncbi:MAG: hypothetical protein FVQ81_01905 [Candidatus Glassbacteria bacterium]|nr:hypothetical protein [Candidatus Glassbacteria bacterium]
MNIDRRTFLGSLCTLPAIGSAAAFSADTKSAWWCDLVYPIHNWWKTCVTGEWPGPAGCGETAQMPKTTETVAGKWESRGRLTAEDVFGPLPPWVKIESIRSEHTRAFCPDGAEKGEMLEIKPGPDGLTDDEFVEQFYGRA